VWSSSVTLSHSLIVLLYYASPFASGRMPPFWITAFEGKSTVVVGYSHPSPAL
jgi:hypothetical protein